MEMSKSTKVYYVLFLTIFMMLLVGCQLVEKTIETPVIEDPTENVETIIDSNDHYVGSSALLQLKNMSIMPNLKEKVESSMQRDRMTTDASSPNISLSSKLLEATPFTLDTTEHFQRTWIYMMINEDIPLLQAWATSAKNQLDYIANQVTQQFDIENSEILYDTFYLLSDTTFYVKFSTIADHPEGVSLTFVDVAENIDPGNFLYIEYQSYADHEVNVSSVRFSLVAAYNTDHYISIYIENRGDDYIQIHDITNYKDGFNNDIIAGRNLEFTFNDQEFYIWRIDHGFYYTDPSTASNKEYGVSFQIYEKNEFNQVIDYNSSHFVTYVQDYFTPSETVSIMPDNNEIYFSPYIISNLESFVAIEGTSDYQITQLTFDGSEVDALFGDAFSLNDGTGRLVIDINNRYIGLNPSEYIQFLLDEGAEFKFDLLQIYEKLVDIHTSYQDKTAFGFQPLASELSDVYDYFMTNYYTDRQFISDLADSLRE